MAATATAGDLDDLLDVVPFDGVVVCTPPDRQVEDAMRAVRHGKAVIVEKPCGLSVLRVEELRTEAARRGVPCLAGYHLAVNPMVENMKRLLSEDAFGRPERAAFRMYVDRERPHGNWLRDPDRSGGAMTETLVHGFHLADMVLGPVDEIVTAVTSGSQGAGLDSTALAVLRHCNGCLTMVEAAWRGSPAVRSGFLEVLGSRGGFSVDRGFQGHRGYWGRTEQRGEVSRQTLMDDDVGFAELLRRLVHVAQGGSAAVASVELASARRALYLALRARERARDLVLGDLAGEAAS
jgi:myo-inositol 2-dehydrogenase/D-chiro-inositol 1-dehydrogenase